MLWSCETKPGCLRRIANKDTVRIRFCRRSFRVNYLLEDMVYLNALGQPILVIHSLKTAAELLDRRAHIYSSRPRLIMAHEILTGGLLASFLPYGDA